jgi:chromosome segregation ATPase
VNAASFAPTEGRIKEAKAAIASLMSYVESLEAPKRKVSRKPRKQKSVKATAATRIADRQERAFHGKADTPVTPRHTKRTASVEEARKAAQEVSDKTGATARAKRKAEALKEAVRTSCQERADMASQPSVSDARLADLEAKIEALLALQAMGHDMMRNENEVLFSDLPFDPDFNHYEG